MNSVGYKRIKQSRQHTVSSLLPNGWQENVYSQQDIASRSLGTNDGHPLCGYDECLQDGICCWRHQCSSHIVHQLLRTFLLSKRLSRVRIPSTLLQTNSIKAALHHSAVLQNCILFLMIKVGIHFGSCASKPGQYFYYLKWGEQLMCIIIPYLISYTSRCLLILSNSQINHIPNATSILEKHCHLVFLEY